jgi:hypothetical protein
MAVSLSVPFGVFRVIGIGYAARAASAWWPTERLLMEDVSCGFHPVETRAGTGHSVPPILIDRLVFLLARYLTYIGSPWPEGKLREGVEQFIREYPTPDSATEDAETPHDTPCNENDSRRQV